MQVYGTGFGTSPAPPPCAASTDTNTPFNLAYNFVDASGHNNGNVVSIANTVDNTRSQNFTYDALNRLATAQTQTTGVTIPNANCWGLTFGYDAWGNLLSQSNTGPGGCSGPLPLSATVGTSNRIATNTVAGSVTNYCFDAAGNLIHSVTSPSTCPASGPYQYTFDAENHLIAAGGLVYKYDGDGNRISKAPSATPTSPNLIYWYGGSGNLQQESDGAGNGIYSHFYFNGRRIKRVEWQHGGWFDHYAYDHLGNARYVYGYNGATDVSDFYPFGGERAISSAEGNKFKFTGKERDSESGLDNFRARFDSSTLGRFMSPDSGVDQHPEAPQSWNLYNYGLNNPLNLVDPTGEYVCGAGVTQTMCDNFQRSLDAAQADANKLKETYGADSTEYKDAQRAVDFYGEENIDNGVTLTLGGQPKDAEGQVDPHVGSTTPTAKNPLGQKITVHFAESAFSGSPDEALVITHEGSHGADASDWVKSGFSPAKNPSLYQTEWRAFHVTQSIAEASGYGPVGFIDGQRRTYIWEPAWAKQAGWGRRVDAAVDSMLRDKNGIYGWNPLSKVGAFQRNTKGNQ
jgi:RHS repeat-associated protein